MVVGSTQSVTVLLALTVASMGLIWAGGSLLESASEELATYYELPAVVRGSIVVAIGSSSPELASIVIATFRYGSFELGVGAIVGSAIFDVLVIPALSGLFSQGSLESSRTLVHKETQFYMWQSRPPSSRSHWPPSTTRPRTSTAK